MANTSKQVTATMTEVKNKIGTVFDKVDKYGQVVITSYSRTRYVISKIEDDEKIQVPKAVEAVTEMNKPEANRTEELRQEPPVVEKTPEIAENVVEIEPVPAVEEKKSEIQPEVGNLRGAFLDLESFLWDRKSPVELSWVKKTRLSF